jgi:hypothetical protein
MLDLLFMQRPCPCETAENLRVRRRMGFGTYEGKIK